MCLGSGGLAPNYPVWLVISSLEDHSAAVMAERLRCHGLNPLIHAVTQELAWSTWNYRAEATARCSRLTLPDGQVLDSATLRGVLNRLVAVPADELVQIRPEDRDYASQELTALYTSWLYGLPCPVINRPSGAGLCGAWPDRSEWLRQAFAAGLPASRYSLRAGENPALLWSAPSEAVRDTMETVILLDGRAVDGRPPAELAPALQRFACGCGSRLIGLQFDVEDTGQWRFNDATPVPDLAAAGAGLSAALARALGGP